MDKVVKIKEKFGDKILKWYEHNPKRIYIDIKKEDLLDFTREIFDNLGARFIIESGVDTYKGIEIIYHYMFDETGEVVNLRALVKEDENGYQIESISNIIPGAKNIEREIFEMFGVTFLNHPNLRRFLLGKEFPEGEYPLRKKRIKRNR